MGASLAAMAMVLHTLAPIALFFGIFLAIVNMRRPSRGVHRGSTAFFIAAWLLQGVSLVLMTIATGSLPLRNTEEFLGTLGWIVLSLHLIVWFRSGMQAAGLVLPPIAFLMMMASIVIPAPRVDLPATQQRGWFLFHTTVATIGLAVLSVAFAMSVIYLVQDRAIKAKRSLRLLEKLPSLAACDRVGFHALVWGFCLLTLGIATGVVWNMVVYETYWLHGPKQVFPVLAWFVFALLFYARLVRGLRGRKSAYLTITGFALGLMTILGMAR